MCLETGDLLHVWAYIIARRYTYASTKAQLILGRPLCSLEEAVVTAGESLIHYGLVYD